MEVGKRILFGIASIAMVVGVFFLILAFPPLGHYNLFMPIFGGCMVIVISIFAICGAFYTIRYIFTGETPFD